jgi:hypothetical protein
MKKRDQPESPLLAPEMHVPLHRLLLQSPPDYQVLFPKTKGHVTSRMAEDLDENLYLFVSDVDCFLKLLPEGGIVRKFAGNEAWKERLVQCGARMLTATRQGIPLEPRCAGEELIFWILPLGETDWDTWAENVLQDFDVQVLLQRSGTFEMTPIHETSGFQDYNDPDQFWLEFRFLKQKRMQPFSE